MDKKILLSKQTNVYGLFDKDTFYPWMNIPSGVIRIVLLKQCNFHCPHCFAEGDSNRNINMLPVDYVIKVMSFAAKHYGVRTARLTGGEPLLYPDLEKLFIGLQENGVNDIDITTNGTLLEEKIPLLKKYGVTNIKVSLNTIDPELYPQLSGVEHNYLEQVLKGIKAAKKEGFRIIISHTALDNISVKQMWDVLKYAHDNDIVFRTSEPYYIFGKTETNVKKNFNQFVAEMKAEAKNVISSQCESVDYIFLKDGTKVTVMYNLCDNRLCDVCVKYLYVRLTPEFKLKPCLSRTDTEVEIPVDATDEQMHLAFMKVGAALGKGIQTRKEIGLKL